MLAYVILLQFSVELARCSHERNNKVITIISKLKYRTPGSVNLY